MDNQETIKKMKKMRLHGMARAFEETIRTPIEKKFTSDELIAHMTETEWDDRHNRKLQRLVKAAKFRTRATFQQIDFQIKRNLDKNLMLRISNCNWIQQKKNIIITGSTGVGKSFIAEALGHQACVHEFKTACFIAQKLFTELKCAKGDGTYFKKLKHLKKQDLLILDDFGLHPFDTNARLTLLEIMQDRYGFKSTMIVSQFPVQKWHEIIGDPTIADAFCDRLVHSSYRIDLKGESVRKSYRQKDF